MPTAGPATAHTDSAAAPVKVARSGVASLAARAERSFQPLGPVKSLAGALAATGLLLPPAMVERAVDRKGAGTFPRLWHRAVSRALGVRSQLAGEPAQGSVLYVANHLSWLDIPVVGGHLGGSFVAKAEVGEMGIVGFLADLQRTIYVERERRTRSAGQADAIRTRLEAGDNIILFPEGTSNDGVRILPFKSSLFSVVETTTPADIRIQPVTIAYTRLNGLPLTRQRLMELAWIGDVDLGPHVLDCLRLGRIDAQIMCHTPVRRSDFADRKALARYCQTVITDGYRQMTKGRM